MQVSRKLRVCAGFAGVAAAAACTGSPVAPSRAEVAESAVLGLGYGSGHRSVSMAVQVRGRDSAQTMTISGGLGYGSGH